MVSNNTSANIIKFLNSNNTQQGSFLSTGSSFNYGTYRASQPNLIAGSGGLGFRTNNGSTAHITFYAGNADTDFSTAQMQIFAPTGNVQFQNGGTYTDIPSAKVAVNSTTQGVLLPRMTTTQRNAITTPATGLMVFNTDQKRVNFYDGAAWQYSPTAFTGTAAPTTTPLVVGDTFTDSTNKKMYVSTGTASSADWTILN